MAIFTRPSAIDPSPAANLPISSGSDASLSSPAASTTFESDPSSLQPEVSPTVVSLQSKPVEEGLKSEPIDSQPSKAVQSPSKVIPLKESSPLNEEEEPRYEFMQFYLFSLKISTQFLVFNYA